MTNYMEFKPNEKYASKLADTSPFHEAFQDCGYVLTDEDLIVDIDCLDEKQIEAFIRVFDIKTQIVHTNRGIHVYYKKPSGFKGSTGVCALGFPVEYKHIKNTQAITIKQNGKMRKIDNEGKREPLPNFLKVVKGESLIGLDEGEGRNQKLHAWKFKIASLNDSKKILRFINSQVFANPLEESEFQTVTREEEILAEKNGEPEVAKQLIRKLKVKKYCEVLYLYQDGKYTANTEFRTIVAEQLEGQKTRYIDEVIKQMEYRLFNEPEPPKGWDIRFKNGILRNGEWIEVDSTEFTPHYIDIDLDEEAEPVKVVDNFINDLTEGDEDYRKLLLEIIALSYITNPSFKRNRNFQKVFFFMGDGGNGKGVLFNVIKKLVGIGNYSPVKLNRFDDERYLYSMKGMLANLGDDIENKPLNNEIMSNLKNLSGYDEIQLRKLYAQPVDVVVTATQMFTTNHLLKSFEKGEAWKRRAVWCPVFHKPKENDPHFQEKLMSEQALQYWLRLVMEALDRLITNGDMTKCERVEAYTQEYHEENNTCLTFVRDHEPDDFIGKRTPEIYDQYVIWVEENYGEGTAIGKKTLQETIEKLYGLKVGRTTVNNKTARIYVDNNKPRSA